MGKSLPDYDPSEGPYSESKRRREIFKRFYREMESWRAQQEDYGISPFLPTPDGEEIYYGDLMIGRPTLPERQGQAFDLICIQGYTEIAAKEVMSPDSKWSSHIQQYSDDGLKKMILAYDAKQDGTWDPDAAMKKRRASTRKKDEVTAPTEAPAVPENNVEPAPQTPTEQKSHRWNWDQWSNDHSSLADYINTVTGLAITPAQVKAVSFLRQEWYNSPEQVTARKEAKEARQREREKFAHETPEQRAKRHEAARKLKSAKRIEEDLKRLQEEARKLRIEAGLDPETGEPVASP